MSKQVTADVVHAALEKKEISIIDVRTPKEFLKGFILGSINIPINEIGEKIGSVIPDKNKTVYLYCLSGSRSETAAYILEGQGYTNAYSMTNGLLKWRTKKFGIIFP